MHTNVLCLCRYLMGSLFLVLLLSPLPAQEISNVRADANAITRQIIISYDLKPTQSRFDRFKVEIYLSENGGESFSEFPLEWVNGNAGSNLEPGKNKRVQWRYYQEDPNFDGKNVVFRVQAERDEFAHFDRISSLKGPEGALYSLLMPGLGDYKVRSGRNFWMITAVTYGILGTGIYLYVDSRNTFDQYRDASSIDQASSLLDRARDQNRAGKVLMGTGAAFWFTDVVLTFIKGQKNKKELKRLKNQFQIGQVPKRDWQFTWAPTFQQPGIRLGLRF